MPTTTEWMQFGPFVALVFALAWGAYILIPKALAIHEAAVARWLTSMEKLVGDFRAELKDQRDWHEVELGKRDAAIEKIAEAVDRIGSRVS